MDIYSENFNVTLADVGESNSLTNRGILRMLQEVACMHSSTAGFGLNDVEKNGLFWIILNWKLQVFSRPAWNSNLKVNTWCRKHDVCCFYRDFEIYDESNNLVAIATSRWILYDFNKKNIFRITEDFEEIYLKDIYKSVFNADFSERLLEPDNSILLKEYTISQRDIDMNHHVNNLNYLDFASIALPNANYYNNLEVMYKHEAKLGEAINIFHSNCNNVNTITIKNATDNSLHCVLKLY